jgi:hypothetical protein
MSRARCAGKLASNVFKSALGSRDPGAERPWWFVPILLLMSAFEFSHPLVIFLPGDSRRSVSECDYFACIGFMEFARVNRHVFACDLTRIRRIEYRSESIGKVELTAID